MKRDLKFAIISELVEEATTEIIEATGLKHLDGETELVVRQAVLWWLERAYDRGTDRLRDLEQANSLLQAQVERLKTVNARLAKRG